MQNLFRSFEPRWPSWATPVLAAVPVIGVNAVAFYGQLAFLHARLPAPPAVQVLVAAVLESVAVYLAWQAHLAQLANDTSLRLRLGAYGFALVIAVMNYSHYAGPGWRPTFAAVAFGLMSAASPWLWGIYTRRASRDRLMARGLVEEHSLRLGSTRWAWHPVRSAKVMSYATWYGVTDPTQAIREALPGKSPEPGVELSVLDTVPSDVLMAARTWMRATYLAGNPGTQNQLQERFSLSRAQAREVRLEVTAISNGNGHGPT